MNRACSKLLDVAYESMRHPPGMESLCLTDFIFLLHILLDLCRDHHFIYRCLYRDAKWERRFIRALNHTAFEGVTVSFHQHQHRCHFMLSKWTSATNDIRNAVLQKRAL